MIRFHRMPAGRVYRVARMPDREFRPGRVLHLDRGQRVLFIPASVADDARLERLAVALARCYMKRHGYGRGEA